MQPWQDPEVGKTKKKWEKFAEEHLAGDYLARDKAHEFSRERWEKCAEFGALSMAMPEEYGGQGLPLRYTVAAYEGLAHVCADTGFLFGLNSQVFGVQMPLLISGSEELKKEYLPKMCAGKLIGTLGFTEEGAGSDVFHVETRADKTDGGFVVNGKKTFVTNSPDADYTLLFAKTDDKKNAFDFTCFWVPLEGKGVRKGKAFDKASLRTVGFGEQIFEDCFVPDDHVLGGVGRGLNVLQEAVGWERGLLLAHCLGAMERVNDQSIKRANERMQFGKPLAKNQQLSSRIAEAVNNHRIGRTYVYDLAARLDKVGNASRILSECCGAKLFVTDAYVQQMLDATQLWGARGVLNDWSIQQDTRDALSSKIWAGSSETLRNTIAKQAGLKA